jgi:hypothetical protein
MDRELQPTVLLIACGGKTVAIAVQPPLADRACSDAGTVRVEINSIPADCARSVAIAVIVVFSACCGPSLSFRRSRHYKCSGTYRRPSRYSCRIDQCRCSRGGRLGCRSCSQIDRVKAALSIQGMNECRQHQGCKYEARQGDHVL